MYDTGKFWLLENIFQERSSRVPRFMCVPMRMMTHACTAQQLVKRKKSPVQD